VSRMGALGKGWSWANKVIGCWRSGMELFCVPLDSRLRGNDTFVCVGGVVEARGGGEEKKPRQLWRG